ncbi:unnamed protein product [Dracunculus medinensis]|uniref:Transporter n=1 Tax=Dracunculus medinensis TaxID=318479 RepID=A0A0N4UNE3_DRAME|nr:unnamed protein product [Dracunculus medinensis]
MAYGKIVWQGFGCRNSMGNDTQRNTNPEYLNGTYGDNMEIEEKREGWDNKMQFFMGVISYAVGLGNVWRFPYLCQKNGGGAFLIPYILMMIFEGMPLFLIELGIGQKMRTGPVGVWNAIHPYLGGVGVSAAIVSYLVAIYYNVIISWCIYYLFSSFRMELPWGKCPEVNNTIVEECEMSSSKTVYFWNRVATDASNSFEESNGFVYHITFSLILAWFIIYLCVMRGIKSSGKVMYLTATFPYIVTTIFLIRAIALNGAIDGLKYLISPDLSRLLDSSVWLEAATQIFYSMGLGFGGLIAFASYNPIKNNCKKDCVKLSFCNLITSLYTAVLIFCVLGYMGEKNYHSCLDKDMAIILELYPRRFDNLAELKQNISVERYIEWMHDSFQQSEFPLLANVSKYCNYEKIVAEAAEGTGLAFVVFTEAILQFPTPPIWSIFFFLMLLMLGLGSMFGTLEGIITSLNDSNLVAIKKPLLSAIICTSSCLIGLYWVSLFDQFAGSYALMVVAFFEIVAVIYVYGCRKFTRDIELMTGESVSLYWTISWRIFAPLIMIGLFSSSITLQVATEYPAWALFIALTMVICTIAPVPAVTFVRAMKLFKCEPDIPTI